MDYLPKKESELTPWLTNYEAKILSIGNTLGLTPLEITNLQTFAHRLGDNIRAVDTAKTAYDTAVSKKDTQKKTSIDAIRKNVAHLKTNPLWTADMSKDLQTDGIAGNFNPDEFKTVLTIKLVGGHLRIDFVKDGSQGVNVYSRIKGTAAWTFLALDTHSPYYDTKPLATEGVAEVREYMAMGVLHDAEIGLPSDVISITYGG